MIAILKSLAAAQSYRYGNTAANPGGTKFKAERCAYEVWPDNGWHPRQCRKPPGSGPDNLYCRQHARRVESIMARASEP